MNISALIVARNEQFKISECLKSLNFVDEIVVILDRSEAYIGVMVDDPTRSSWIP